MQRMTDNKHLLGGLFWLTALARFAMGVYAWSDPLGALRTGGWPVPEECRDATRAVTALTGALLVQVGVLTSMMAVITGALGIFSRGTNIIICTEMVCDAVAVVAAIYGGGSKQVGFVSVSSVLLCAFGGMLAYRVRRKRKLISKHAQYSTALLADHLAEDV